MTDITPLIPRTACVISAYGTGAIKISGRVYTESLLVHPDHVTSWAGGYDALLNMPDIDVILVGTGRRAVSIDSETRQRFRDKGVNIDVMDTGAACRTYNVLMAEGRRILAALTMIEPEIST